MRRAYFLLLIFVALCAPKARAASPSASPRRTARVEHQVRITPTQLAPGETAIDIGPTQWTLQGYDLRGLLAHVFDIEPARVELEIPQSADANRESAPRYDVSLTLTGQESDADVQSILRKALEEHFHLTTGLETRSMDVYVLTAPAGPGPGLRAAASLRVSNARALLDDASTPETVITVSGRICPGISSGGITAQSATVERLAAALEDNLDRIVLDETHLTPAFNFQIPEYRSRDELFSLLHDHLGLSIRTERRQVNVLTAHAPEVAAPALLSGI